MQHARVPLLIFVAAMAFYVATLAPTVEWGDFGGFQTRVSIGELELHPFGHPLWNLLARPFVWLLPFGDDAFRVNLSSAFFASLTLVMLYFGCMRLTRSRAASLLAVLALGVSHSFWTYAVVPKAYSLTLFILATCILLLPQWREQAGVWRIALVSALLGLGVMNHLLVLTAVPGILLFVMWHSTRPARDLPVFVLGFVAGLLPYLLLLSTAPGKGEVAGGFVSTYVLKFLELLTSPRNLLVGVGLTGVNLAYQFLVLTLVGAWGWWLLWEHDRSLALMLLLIFAGDVAFVLIPTDPPVMMHWHMYHPAYLAFAYTLAVGIRELLHRLGS
ncbi:MAG: DUF2723 domain-containing protein, partial [Chloroflexi bacterium]|nr:DUF2723 domain-containing protein [Chloroflexota bacterium]